MQSVPRRALFVPIAALAVLLGAAVVPADASGPAPGDASTASNATAKDDWPMFGHDPLHSELSPDTTVTAISAPKLAEEWSVDVSGPKSTFPIEASPVVAFDPTLGEPVVYAESTDGNLDAIDGTPGQPPTVIWSTHVKLGPRATPAVYDGTVYVGSNGGFVDALNATTGALECTFNLPVVPPQTVPGRVISSPVVGDVNGTGPIVFFGDAGQSERMSAGHEWAITGVGNSAGGCKEVWSFNGFLNKNPDGKKTGSWSEPGLVQDSKGTWLLVFGSADPDDAIYALNAGTGTEVWRFQTQVTGGDEDVGGGPTISAPGTNGLADGLVYEIGKDHILYALDLLTGKEIWSYNFFAANADNFVSVSVPALKGNTLYETEGGYLYAFNAVTGALMWHTGTQVGPILGSPTVSGTVGEHVVFIGDLTGKFWAFSAHNGAVLWSTTLTTGRDMVDSAISDGVVYTAGGTNLYAFTPTTSAGTRNAANTGNS